MTRVYAIARRDLLRSLSGTGSFSISIRLTAVLMLGLAACTSTVSEQTSMPGERSSASANTTEQRSDAAPSPIDSQALRIQELSAREDSGQTIVTLKLSQPISRYRHFPQTQPSRIVIDVFGNAVVPADMTSFGIGTNLVGTVRFSPGEDSMRIVVDVVSSSPPDYVVFPDDGAIKIVVGRIDPKVPTRRDLALVRGGIRVDSVAAQARNACTAAEPTISAISETVPGVKSYSGDKITLNFKDADIRNIFRILGEVSGKNMVVTDEVNRKVTLRLADVPWDQALDLVIETNGLAKEEIGNVLRISTATTIAKERRELQDARKAAQSSEIPRLTYLNVNYAKVKDLADKVKQLSKTGAEIIPDDRSNTLVVRGSKHDVDEILCIVGKLDVRTPQVLIESNLIETTPSFARALGTRLTFTLGGTTFSSAGPANAPFQGNTTGAFPNVPGGLGGTVSVIQNNLGGFKNVAVALEAAENEGNIKIISRPSVVTLNNQASTIRSERILRILLPSSTNIATGSGSSAAGAAVASEKVPIGIVLTVTPQVSSDGFILMNINVKSSSVAPTAQGGGGQVVNFDELNREAVANVLVRDGDTVVLGGILKDTSQESESGIPYLKEIPIFGWLFKNHRWQKDFEELMVFITPRITGAGAVNLPTAEEIWREQMRTTYGATGTPSGINP